MALVEGLMACPYARAISVFKPLYSGADASCVILHQEYVVSSLSSVHSDDLRKILAASIRNGRMRCMAQASGMAGIWGSL